MMSGFEDKLRALRDWLSSQEEVVVAYSGGVDSSLLLKVAHEVLGSRCTGVLAASPSLPESERQEALAQADGWGCAVCVIETRETEDADYRRNAPNRCFHCKDHVYGALAAFAQRQAPGAVLVDGMNAEDTLDIRPGRAAAMKHGVRSPLHELGFAKQEVREAARGLGLAVWSKPAAACLSSRVAYGVAVTPELLGRVERAEAVLRGFGFPELRVRHHAGEVARVEVPVEALGRLLEVRERVAGALRELGWLYVTLDLEGLSSGSMNRGLRAAAIVPEREMEKTLNGFTA